MKKDQPRIAIVAGGTLDESLLSQIRACDVVVGVDRGAHWLLTHGLVPVLAIGDFDSVTETELHFIQKKIKKIIRYSSEKDATDLELAVDYTIGLKPKEVGIFGAIGTRFDHVYAGIQMLAKLLSHNICGYLVDKTNKIMIVRRKLTIESSAEYRYVSIFSLYEPATVTLKRFRYNVSRHVFDVGSSLGVSNEIAAESASIHVHKGKIILIQSRD